MAPGKLTDPQAQLLLLDRRDRNGQALGGAVLAHQTASTAGTPGIVPAELRQLCGGVPGSEVTLGQLLLLRRSQGLEHRLIELSVRSLRMICSGVWLLGLMGLILAKSGR